VATAARADAVVALADDELLFVREGIHVQPLRGAGLRAAGAGSLRLESARSPHARRAAPVPCAPARARRLYAASLLLGVLRDACDFSRGYALQRHAFGRPIAHHQALAFLITDMQMALDGARLLVHEAAWRVDQQLPCAGAAAAAFAQCIEASRLIGPAGVQILGGHGFMADYPMEKAMRESRALGLWLGGSTPRSRMPAASCRRARRGAGARMIDFRIDERTPRSSPRRASGAARRCARPGSSRSAVAPLPVEHPYFAKFIERGGGRTRWPGPAGVKREPTSVAQTLLVVEELAYWDRGVTVADPGPGLPETNVLAMGTRSRRSATSARSSRSTGRVGRASR